MNNKTDIDVQYVSPLKKICMTIGELPASYLETMSYYEMLVWFTEFLKNQVIPAVNNNAEAVSELQALYEELRIYVNNYFDNLDIAEEVDNKLEEMAESGELTDIIAQYLGLAGMIVFNTVSDMKLAENLVNGSKCQTLGYHSANDGGKATYLVRTVTNEDVINEMNIIALSNNLLVAELIPDNVLNIKQFGAYGDGETDDTSIINSGISYANSKGINVFVPKGTYIISNKITILNGTRLFGNCSSNIEELNSSVIKATTSSSSIEIGTNSFLTDIDINGNNIASVMLVCSARCVVENVKLFNCLIGIQPITTNANLCIFRNIKIRDSITGINWIDNNSSNGQSCYFENIDMLGVQYGLELDQPGNKFVNLCIQNSPVNCKPINITANSNIFMGTYLENANATKEVDFNSSSYNEFYGVRPLMYNDYFTNNNGKNKIVMGSNQNSNIIYNTGFNAFDKIAIPVKYSANQSPGPVLEIEKDSSHDNYVLMKTNGTSTQTRLNFDTSTSINNENRCFQYGNYNKFKNPFFYKGTRTITSFAPNASYSFESSIFAFSNPIYFAKTNKHNVICEVEKRSGGDGIKVTMYNNSDVDYSNVEITYDIVGCDWIGT